MAQTSDTLLSPEPDRAPWRPWLRRLLPALGTALVLAAVVYFFAANWQRIPAAVRLALVEGGLVLAVGAWLALRRRALHAADAALTAAGVLSGVFWAVFGQIYQTGADAWQLFALWALSVAPWLLLRPATGLWTLWVTVLNVALVSWSAQTGASAGWIDPPLTSALAADTVLWAACLGMARLRPDTYDKATLFGHIVLPFALGCATVLVCAALLGDWGRYPDPVARPRALAGLAVLLAVTLHAALARRAFPLFLLALCGYPLLNCALLQVADDGSVGSILAWYTAGNVLYTWAATRGLLRVRPGPAGDTPRLEPRGPTDSLTNERRDSSANSPARPARSESVLSHLLGGPGGGLSALFITALVAYILYEADALRATGMLTAALILTGAGLAVARRPGSFARTLSLILPLAGFAFLTVGLADRLGFREAATGVALATAALYPFHRHAGWRFVSTLSALLLLRVAFSPDFPIFSPGDGAGRDFLFGDALTLLCALPVLPMARGRRPSAALRPALYAALLSAALTLPAWSPLRGLTLVYGGMASLPVFSPGLQPFTPFTALCGLAFLLLIRREGRGRLTAIRGGAAGLGLLVALALAPVEAAFALVLLLVGHARALRTLEVLGFVLFGAFLAGYYYLLSVPLPAKAFSIGVPGLALLAGTALVPRGSAPAETTDSPEAARGFRLPALRGNARGLAAVALLLATLGVFQYAIYDKQALLARGDTVLLALAPVDPRSLMQGDYMHLAYVLEDRLRAADPPPRGYAVLRLDKRGVGYLADVRTERGEPASGEYTVPYRLDGGNTVLRLPHSFLFEEGRAGRYAAAAYGILRCPPQGGCLLVGLADPNGRNLDEPATAPAAREKLR